jgi:hypothetical protein
MQPEALERGWELFEAVATHLDALVDAAAIELQSWGLDLAHRGTRPE